MPSNTFGRQVVIPLTNKSGGGVVAGDVVIVDTSNNDAFTTTTSGAFTGGIGIAQETIASNAIGRILLSGYAALINVNASVTRGNYGKTHTVVKQAADAGASRVAGTFCQFLTGGTSPDALVYPVDLSATGLTDPMTTRGDIIIRNAANATARLAIGSSGKVLQSDGTDISWQTPSAAAAPTAHACRVHRSSGDVALGNNTYTVIGFNAEDHDTDTMHDNSTNPSRIVIPSISGVTTGLWSISARGYTNATSGRSDLMFRANANTVNSGGTLIGTVIGGPISSSGVSVFQGYEEWVLAAADYVEVFARTTGGSFSAVFEAGDSPIFAMAFLGKVS